MRDSRRREVFSICENRKLTLAYSVLIDKIADCSGNMLKSYGIRVSALERGDTALLRDITVNGDKILELTQTLARNFVTPATLRDVVYDWLCED
ncbi:MAG: DUF6514 family protein [Oscillospiraceae bacterium]|jgi:hypothetical protein|nr:DUF6514 family protein [Oscillospiraceae bacterium]